MLPAVSYADLLFFFAARYTHDDIYAGDKIIDHSLIEAIIAYVRFPNETFK